jgi:hypothetical protein
LLKKLESNTLTKNDIIEIYKEIIESEKNINKQIAEFEFEMKQKIKNKKKELNIIKNNKINSILEQINN